MASAARRTCVCAGPWSAGIFVLARGAGRTPRPTTPQPAPVLTTACDVASVCTCNAFTRMGSRGEVKNAFASFIRDTHTGRSQKPRFSSIFPDPTARVDRVCFDRVVRIPDPRHDWSRARWLLLRVDDDPRYGYALRHHRTVLLRLELRATQEGRRRQAAERAGHAEARHEEDGEALVNASESRPVRAARSLNLRRRAAFHQVAESKSWDGFQKLSLRPYLGPASRRHRQS